MGGTRFAQDASLRDVGVAFRAYDDTARLGDLETLDDAFVDAMSGPSASDADVVGASISAAGPKKAKSTPVHERVGFQVGLPVAVVAVAAIAVAVRASGYGDRAFAAAATRRAVPDHAAGVSTAVASGSGSVVRRTSTSTKIAM